MLLLILTIFFIFSCYLIAIVFSFDTYDPSWLQFSGIIPIHNIGGKIGSWLADTLLFFFGLLTYIIPFIIFYNCCCIFVQRKHINLFNVSIKIISIFLIIITSCCLINFNYKNIYVNSGGIVGLLLSNYLLKFFNKNIITIILLIIWVINVIFLTKIVFLSIIDIIGKITIIIVNQITKIKKNIKKLFFSEKHNLLEIKKINHLNNELNKNKNLIKKKHDIKFISKFNNFNFFSKIFTLPSMSILPKIENKKYKVDNLYLDKQSKLIELYLINNYNIKVKILNIITGPVITRFQLDVEPGVSVSIIYKLSKQLAKVLSTDKLKITKEIINGKYYIGIDIPNKQRNTIYLNEVLDSHEFITLISPLSLILGKNIFGNTVVIDLKKIPNLLVAGTKGSGKTVGLHTMILSILYKATPQQVGLIIIDPYILELSVYNGIPHLLTNVVTDINDAMNILCWCISEMERRYQLMSLIGLSDLDTYNKYIKTNNNLSISILEPLPYIVIIVHELSDIIGNKIEDLIVCLSQKAQDSGIHLILSTQRPSLDIIKRIMNNNMTTRIAFTVSSKTESIIILDQTGAESLLGMGDMLYLAPNASLPIRVHGVLVHNIEINSVVNYWKNI
ncbi:DNA translocase FtsK 4TM domain-containing protein [Candidatus Palibaumannia cicadellinicola]|uniref:Cell division protein n=1 Tax=Candidatus Palibaumannia cicadellinicola TaxID=186490 RepID=A0A0K2BKY5_9GAMM|nr:DNA translocase FtsK 4TM domain-containing protein [Candidatus Baumannia cicadellinicola]AKZ65864.1 Cell division protein [Candidatus Baumannia cicadellinicola]